MNFRIAENSTNTTNNTLNESTNTTSGFEPCDEEEDEDCEKEYFEIDCPECEEDYDSTEADTESSTEEGSDEEIDLESYIECEPDDEECLEEAQELLN